MGCVSMCTIRVCLVSRCITRLYPVGYGKPVCNGTSEDLNIFRLTRSPIIIIIIIISIIIIIITTLPSGCTVLYCMLNAQCFPWPQHYLTGYQVVTHSHQVGYVGEDGY